MMRPSVLFLLTFLTFIMKGHANLPVRLLSHNIRYATPSPFEGEKPWADRRPLLLNELRYNTLYNAEAFICLQEVLHQQLVDIMGDLGPEWDYIGVGRDDGNEAGEYSPIIFRKGVWKVDHWRTYWLSETPDKPIKGWDAASVRIVTVGTFVHKPSRKKIVGMSTHLDDQGSKSRAESAKLILRIVDQQTGGGHHNESIPVFLAGDLNSEPSGSAFQILNGQNSTLMDVKEVAQWHYGDNATFTGWLDSTPKTLIDHIFVGRKGSFKILGYSVLENKFEDGVYNSDHRAVVSDTVLKVHEW